VPYLSVGAHRSRKSFWHLPIQPLSRNLLRLLRQENRQESYHAQRNAHDSEVPERWVSVRDELRVAGYAFYRRENCSGEKGLFWKSASTGRRKPSREKVSQQIVPGCCNCTWLYVTRTLLSSVPARHMLRLSWQVPWGIDMRWKPWAILWRLRLSNLSEMHYQGEKDASRSRRPKTKSAWMFSVPLLMVLGLRCNLHWGSWLDL